MVPTTVLLVDDERLPMEYYIRAIEKYGFTVEHQQRRMVPWTSCNAMVTAYVRSFWI